MSKFVDEIIGGDGKRKYKIIAEDGTILYSGVRIEKDYTPEQEGTHITAQMLNNFATADGTIKANADRLQGKSISTTAPTAGQKMMYTGTMWMPYTTIVSSGVSYGTKKESSPKLTNLGFTPDVVVFKSYDPHDSDIRTYLFNGSTSEVTMYASSSPRTYSFSVEHWYNNDWVEENKSDIKITFVENGFTAQFTETVPSYYLLPHFRYTAYKY